MNLRIVVVGVIIMLSWPSGLIAQFLLAKEEIPVFADGGFLTRAWQGGHNQPQFSIEDLDQDGNPELIAYNRQAIHPEVYTWDALSESWIWIPGRGKVFPALNDWMLVAQMDCDNLPDLVMSPPDTSGMAIHYGAANWTWEPATPPLSAGSDLVYVLRTDISALADVDADGDTDLLSFNEAGSQVIFYEHPDSCRPQNWVINTECWGQFSEAGLNNDIFLNTSCLQGNSGGPAIERNGAHAGSTLAAADVSGDGIQDLLIGDLNQNTVVYLRNGGTAQFASMDQVTTSFPGGGQAIQLRKFPATYPLDIDQDGDKDLLVAPNDPVAGRNANQIWLYENQSTGPAWNLVRTHTDWLVGEMIDLGEQTHPALVDVDGDGLLDLVVGNYAFRDGDTGGNSSLWYFQNTGTATSPAFDLITDDWLSIGSLFNPPIFGLAPSFGDLDQDGDLDLVLGDQDGNIHLFRNSAGAGNPMNLFLDSPVFLGLDVGKFAMPVVGDLNGDGQTDILIGAENGTLTYLPHSGTTGQISFGNAVSDFGGVSSLSLRRVAPAFRGEDEIWLGAADGLLRLMTGIDSALQGQDLQLADSAYGHLERIALLSPAFADLDADGYEDLICGNLTGGLKHFEESQTNSISRDLSASFPVSVVNPVEGNELVIWMRESGTSRITLTLLDLRGNSLLTISFRPDEGQCQVPLPDLPSGTYLLRLSNRSGVWHKKIVLNR